MRVVIIEPGKAAYESEIENSLNAEQEIVGGYIEVVYNDDDTIIMSDNFNERIEQKIFHCEIVVDADKVKREESAYKKIPVITDFTDADGNDRMKETVQANYRRIKEEVKQIVQEELERIAGDDNLKHLLQQK